MSLAHTPINEIIQGDYLEKLRMLPNNSIDCVITSPPYWNLRDYNVEGQLGLEPTFEEFVTKLCDVFDEVKRVLKPTGSCYVNIGDTYANTTTGGQGLTGGIDKSTLSSTMQPAGTTPTKRAKQSIPAKSLCQIPSRFAIEMSNRGWLLRNEIVWHKTNCMPESVTDRYTNDHEKVFFFTKSPKYYFDQSAILETVSPNTHARLSQDVQNQIGSARANGGRKTNGNMKAVGRKYDPASGNKNNPSFDAAMAIMPQKRNKRTVWSISTAGLKEAHFAVFPEDLIKPMVLSSCPEQGVILDPFFGSGTTGLVAKNLNRCYLGIELNSDYIKIAEERLRQEVLL